jgi:hypothetical protein
LSTTIWEWGNILFFIDESGSIPKNLDKRYKNKYFVITFVHTDNPSRLENTYKHAIDILKSKFPSFFASLPNPNELKGSETPPFMKLFIIDRLLSKTDIRIAHMVVDNWEIEQRFRNIPGRSFNFLVKIIMENFSMTSNDLNKLILKIDNRNTALKGLQELEGYLYGELVLNSGIINDVKVSYLESKHNRGIQVADMISHIIYQRFRYKNIQFPKYNTISSKIDLMHPYTYEYLYQIIKPRITTPFVYPVKSNLIREAAATFSL